MDDDREPLARSECAQALLMVLALDRHLLRGATVLESREPGFVGRILVDAQVWASRSMVETVPQTRAELARSAVYAALENADTRLAGSAAPMPPSSRVTALLADLVEAQARFHLGAGQIERRDWNRVNPPRR